MMLPFVDIHTHKADATPVSIRSLRLGGGGVPQWQPGSFSAGVHPWDAESVGAAGLEQALALLETAPLAAVGEIGLDYARAVDRDRQREVFGLQLDVALRRGLPVVLHCVRAMDDTLAVLRGKEFRAVIFHGFSGPPEQALQLVRMGYYLSFGEALFRSDKAAEALAAVPLERVFFETDDSPATIDRVYDCAAHMLEMPEQELQQAIYTNYERIFG